MISYSVVPGATNCPLAGVPIFAPTGRIDKVCCVRIHAAASTPATPIAPTA